MGEDGLLLLGVNDTSVEDNRGSFVVEISAEGSPNGPGGRTRGGRQGRPF